MTSYTIRVELAENPFVYDRPLAPDQLIDREVELARLLELCQVGQSVRLGAPRRYGKTTLLRRACRDAETAGLVAVLVDFSGVLSLEDVAIRVADAYRALEGPLRRIVRELLRSLGLRVRVGEDVSIEAGITPSRHNASSLERLSQLLDLPAALHRRTGNRVLVVFDEFQALLGVEASLDGVIRSRIQHHAEAATYMFAGSGVSLMRALFADRERPLYGQAQPVDLPPLPDQAVASYVEDRFQAARVDVSEVIDAYLAFVKGHPQRAMLVAHHLWRETTLADADPLAGWDRAREASLAELAEAFEVLLGSFTVAQRAVLRQVARSETGLYSRDALRQMGLEKSGAQQALGALLEAGQLVRVERGQHRLIDPLLAEWLRAPRA